MALPAPPTLQDMREADGTAQLGPVADKAAANLAALLARAEAILAELQALLAAEATARQAADAAEAGARAAADTGLQNQVDLRAPLASPSLTGTPTAPTAAGGTSTGQLATTAFVQDAVSAGTAGLASSSSLASYAPLNSPNFSGNPQAPKRAWGDNSNSIAVTSWVNDITTWHGQRLDSIESRLSDAGIP